MINGYQTEFSVKQQSVSVRFQIHGHYENTLYMRFHIIVKTNCETEQTESNDCLCSYYPPIVIGLPNDC